LPVSVILLLLEHIAIAQSFGRVTNYKINPNQELLVIGITNLVGPSFGAHAATGLFSRTAIKAKSGAAYQFWLVQLLGFFIFRTGVVVTIFASIDIGIYATKASTLALLLIRVAHPQGRWLG
ncbi:unnamed protein product, partial [Tilletia laevis]